MVAVNTNYVKQLDPIFEPKTNGSNARFDRVLPVVKQKELGSTERLATSELLCRSTPVANSLARVLVLK